MTDHNLISFVLGIVAIYCALMYLICAYRAFRYKEDYEFVSSMLGLNFILALGFLGLGA